MIKSQQVERKKNTTANQVKTKKKAKAPKEAFASGGGFFERMLLVYENPAFKYIAGDLATLAFGKLIEKLTVRYPEVTNLVTSGLTTIEGKLVDYKKETSESEDLKFQH